jgi:hypothetical protein
MIILSANDIPIMSTSGSSIDHQQQKPATGQNPRIGQQRQQADHDRITRQSGGGSGQLSTA